MTAIVMASGQPVLVASFGAVLCLAAGLIAGALVARRRDEAVVHALATEAQSTNRPALQAVAKLRDQARQGEADATAAETRLRAVLDTFAQGVILFGPDDAVSYANQAGASLLGGHHGEALVMAAVRELIAMLGQTGRQSAARQLSLVGPPRRSFDISVRLLTGGEQIAVVDDVTERRRLEDVRRDFVANISHELKTPIGALSLLAETIVAEEDPDLVERLAARMHTEALRVSMTIDDLLLLSRIEADNDPPLEDVAVDDVVDEVVSRLAQGAADRSIRIERALPRPPLRLRGDRRQLVSALYNLIENAVKYSEDGSAVTVAASREGEVVHLAVSDQGMGIPARDLERVFERFYRVDRARSRRTGGTGLGLAIVRHVAQNHGGQVSVRSIEGEGSTFTLTLPIERNLPA